MQILEEEEDGKSLARCDEKRKEEAKHWQGDTEVQNSKGRFAVEAARTYKANTGVGFHGFHPKVPLDLERNWRRGG